jgi:hypothetical protein
MKDTDGSLITGKHTDALQVEILSNNSDQPVHITDVTANADGTYNVNYSVPKGSYKVTVNLNGNPIHGSPFSVVPVPAFDSGRCKAYGPGLESPIEGDPTSFTVELYDKDGTLIKENNSKYLKIQVKGNDGKVKDIDGVQHEANGTYSANYNAPSGTQYNGDLLDCILEIL